MSEPDWSGPRQCPVRLEGGEDGGLALDAGTEAGQAEGLEVVSPGLCDPEGSIAPQVRGLGESLLHTGSKCSVRCQLLLI